MTHKDVYGRDPVALAALDATSVAAALQAELTPAAASGATP